MQKFKAHLCLIWLGCILLSFQSCVSRLRRPEITGVIVDYDKNPIANCTVGEALTDKKGRFKLAEERYNAFLLTEIFAMEAPPLMVFEPVEKEGFEKDAVSMYSTRGGGQSKGAKYKIDTIFLRRTNETFDISALLKNSDWKLAFNKQADTIYLLKNGFREWCKTDRCSPFYSEYQRLVDNAYTGAKNLPEGMIRRMIEVRFDAQKSPFEINMICEYNSTFDGPNRPPDTTNTKGSYQVLNNTKMLFDAGKLKALTGKYNISDVDLYQMKLTKLK
ncbi:hypothetical protein ASE92_06035 [Pedobacter sp. Leaf41]|uniref:hypothetical protein n=1 Tax=Pedobacter sp. Leaf41 TaxID=1736218 RepID=UPI000703B99B|nr:hypothetical protein [Pedobacter sp. Leaf41]KQN38971.1 hypothetical protein ASE92_06035 [Pedobacter sp. Leaf41]